MKIVKMLDGNIKRLDEFSTYGMKIVKNGMLLGTIRS
jgi:hypothetical protein